MGIKYTTHVGKKFNKDGSFREFKGNTVICSIGKDNSTFEHIAHVQDIFKDDQIAEAYSFLPQESFHMTLIEGVCDQIRNKEHWPSKLQLDANLEKVNNFFKDQEKHFPSVEGFEMDIDFMKYIGYIVICLKPSNAKSKDLLKVYRDIFAEKTGLRFENHDTYGFHITLAYQIQELSEEREDEMKILVQKAEEYLKKNVKSISNMHPKISYFENMGNFTTVQDKKRDSDAKQINNPLHGVKLAEILELLVEEYGWEVLGRIIRIRCFTYDPCIKSSLKFLRRTPWAREKLERLYLDLLREMQ